MPPCYVQSQTQTARRLTQAEVDVISREIHSAVTPYVDFEGKMPPPTGFVEQGISLRFTSHVYVFTIVISYTVVVFRPVIVR